MLINRKSSRRGPKYNQIYVPHDQRQLNPPLRIIQTEEEAQNYYHQLEQMGYINVPIYEILQISAQTDSTVTFATSDYHPGVEYTGVGLIRVLHIGGQILSKGEYYLLSGDITINAPPGIIRKGGMEFQSSSSPYTMQLTFNDDPVTFHFNSCAYISTKNPSTYQIYDTVFNVSDEGDVHSLVQYYPTTSCNFKIPAGGMIRVLHVWDNE